MTKRDRSGECGREWQEPTVSPGGHLAERAAASEKEPLKHSVANAANCDSAQKKEGGVEQGLLPLEISYCARQPILDERQEVLGYEVLYRRGPENAAGVIDPTHATLSVISSVFFAMGREAVVGSRLLFLNVGAEVLSDERVTVLPPKNLVLEILEDVAVDDGILRHCQSLRERGFQLALDDVVDVASMEKLRGYLDFVKIDFLHLHPSRRDEVFQAAVDWKIPIIAEKVETNEDFQTAKQLGAKYFQGYFFAKPNMLRAQMLQRSQSHQLAMLAEVCKPDVNFERVECLLREDISLSWMFFRFLNSPQFSWNTEIRSLRHAFALLGTENLRKWILVAVIPWAAARKPHELVVESLLRARFCELLAQSTNLYARASELFLVGLLSVLDAILDAPLAEVIRELNLPRDVRDVLAGENSANPWMRRMAALVREYTMLDSSHLQQQCSDLHVDPHMVAQHYLEADRFARNVLQMSV